MDYAEVCSADCFYESKNMLVIKSDECIDCGVCELSVRSMQSSPIPNKI